MKYSKCDHVIERKIGEQSIVTFIGEQTGPFLFDGIGALIWNSIVREESLEIIVDKIICDYDVDPLDARNDIAEFVKQLLNEGLIIPKKDEAPIHTQHV